LISIDNQEIKGLFVFKQISFYVFILLKSRRSFKSRGRYLAGAFFYRSLVLNMSTAVEEKDIVKFVTEEEINRASTEETTKQEEPKEQSAAFNPETGEINWDCPCK
jgi:hypothetical protein